MAEALIRCEDCKRTFIDEETLKLHRLCLGNGDFFRCATAEEQKYALGFQNVASFTSSFKVYSRVIFDQGVRRPIREGEVVEFPYRKAGYKLVP